MTNIFSGHLSPPKRSPNGNKPYLSRCPVASRPLPVGTSHMRSQERTHDTPADTQVVKCTSFPMHFLAAAVASKCCRCPRLIMVILVAILGHSFPTTVSRTPVRRFLIFWSLRPLPGLGSGPSREMLPCLQLVTNNTTQHNTPVATQKAQRSRAVGVVV